MVLVNVCICMRMCEVIACHILQASLTILLFPLIFAAKRVERAIGRERGECVFLVIILYSLAFLPIPPTITSNCDFIAPHNYLNDYNDEDLEKGRVAYEKLVGDSWSRSALDQASWTTTTFELTDTDTITIEVFCNEGYSQVFFDKQRCVKRRVSSAISVLWDDIQGAEYEYEYSDYATADYVLPPNVESATYPFLQDWLMYDEDVMGIDPRVTLHFFARVASHWADYSKPQVCIDYVGPRQKCSTATGKSEVNGRMFDVIEFDIEFPFSNGTNVDDAQAVSVTLGRFNSSATTAHHILFTDMSLTVDCPVKTNSSLNVEPNSLEDVTITVGNNIACAGSEEKVHFTMTRANNEPFTRDAVRTINSVIFTKDSELDILNVSCLPIEGNTGGLFDDSYTKIECEAESPPEEAQFRVVLETVLGIGENLTNVDYGRIIFFSDSNWDVSTSISLWSALLFDGTSPTDDIKSNYFQWKTPSTGVVTPYMIMGTEVRYLTFTFNPFGPRLSPYVPYDRQPLRLFLSTFAIKANANDTRVPRACIIISTAQEDGNSVEMDRRCSSETPDTSENGMIWVNVDFNMTEYVGSWNSLTTEVTVYLSFLGSEEATSADYPILFSNIDVTADCEEPRKAGNVPTKPRIGPPSTRVQPEWGCSLNALELNYEVTIITEDEYDNGGAAVIDTIEIVEGGSTYPCLNIEYEVERRKSLTCTFFSENPIEKMENAYARLTSIFLQSVNSVAFNYSDSSDLGPLLYTPTLWNEFFFNDRVEATIDEAMTFVNMTGDEDVDTYIWINRDILSISADIKNIRDEEQNGLNLLSDRITQIHAAVQTVSSPYDLSQPTLCLLLVDDQDDSTPTCTTGEAFINEPEDDDEPEDRLPAVYTWLNLTFDIPTELVGSLEVVSIKLGRELISEDDRTYPILFTNLKIFENCGFDLKEDQQVDEAIFAPVSFDNVNPRGLCSDLDSIATVKFFTHDETLQFRSIGPTAIKTIDIEFETEDSSRVKLPCENIKVVLEEGDDAIDPSLSLSCDVTANGTVGTAVRVIQTTVLEEKTSFKGIDDKTLEFKLIRGGVFEDQLNGSAWVGDDVWSSGSSPNSLNRDSPYLILTSGTIYQNITEGTALTNYLFSTQILQNPKDPSTVRICIIANGEEECTDEDQLNRAGVLRPVVQKLSVEKQTLQSFDSFFVTVGRTGDLSNPLPILFSGMFLSRACITETEEDDLLDINVKLPDIGRVSPRTVCPNMRAEVVIAAADGFLFGDQINEATVLNELNLPTSVMLGDLPCVIHNSTSVDKNKLVCYVDAGAATTAAHVSITSIFDSYPYNASTLHYFSVVVPTANFVGINDLFTAKAIGTATPSFKRVGKFLFWGIFLLFCSLVLIFSFLSSFRFLSPFFW